jgi:hypothetical protein
MLTMQCNFPYQSSIFGVSKPMAAMDASSQTAISLQNEAAIRCVPLHASACIKMFHEYCSSLYGRLLRVVTWPLVYCAVHM